MSNPFKNKIFQKSMLGTGVFALSLGVTFWIASCVMKPTANQSINNNVLPQGNNLETPGDRLLNSIFNYEAMNFDADISILMQDNTKLDFNLVGQTQIKDLDNIKLSADLSANLDGALIDGQFGYFGDTLSFSLENVCYFKLQTQDLMDFIAMVPTYGVTLEVPESLSNLSIDDLTDSIASIAPEDKKTTPSGDYYYNLSFGSGDQAINVMVLTDTNDYFKGIRVETFYYQGNKFSINATIQENNVFTRVNPLDYDTENKYQDFSPMFTLFDVFYDLTKKEQLGISADIVLESKEEGSADFSEMLSANFAVNMDVAESLYGIKATVNENSRTHIANFAYAEQTIFAKFHNVAISIGSETISDLITYVIRQIDQDTISGLFSNLSEGAGDFDIGGLSTSLKNMIKNISVSSGNFSMTIDLKEFGLEDCSLITLGVDFSNEKVDRIYVSRSEIKNIAFSLDLRFVDYVEPTINKDEYTSLEPALIAVQSIMELLDENRFRLELDANLDNEDPSKGDIAISGGVQFALDPNRTETSNNGFGYGELTIVDGDGYHHNIKANMESMEEIYLSYNDTMNVSFNIQTLKDMFGVIMDLVEDPDDHFLELFGELLDRLNNSPLALALAGDYGLLLQYDIISNLNINTTGLSFDISFAIFGMDNMSAHIAITYEMVENANGTYSYLFHTFGISNLNFEGMNISATIELKEFDDSLNSTRLDPSLEYMDFSDIKVLLELGINTSKFNYYHFTTTVNATLTAIGLDLKDIEIPMDIKIRNDHGKVQVAAEIDMPIVKLLLVPVNGAPDGYYSASNRKVSFYYTSEENYFYIHRTETVKTALIFGKTVTYDLCERLTVDYFLDNILEIIMADMFGFGDTVMSLIESSTSSSGSSQMHYEKILEDFQYNKKDNYFEFALNVNELANTTVFTSTVLKVYSNPADNQLTGISATTSISVGLKINLNLHLSLADASIELNNSNRLSKLESHLASHSGDTLNTKIITTY